MRAPGFELIRETGKDPGWMCSRCRKKQAVVTDNDELALCLECEESVGDELLAKKHWAAEKAVDAAWEFNRRTP